MNMPPSLLQMSMQHPSLPSAAHAPSNTSQQATTNLVNNTTDHHNNTTTNSSPASSVSSRTSPLPPAPSPQPSIPQVTQLNGPLPNKVKKIIKVFFFFYKSLFSIKNFFFFVFLVGC